VILNREMLTLGYERIFGDPKDRVRDFDRLQVSLNIEDQ
jgi:hypothetical protein